MSKDKKKQGNNSQGTKKSGGISQKNSEVQTEYRSKNGRSDKSESDSRGAGR